MDMPGVLRDSEGQIIVTGIKKLQKCGECPYAKASYVGMFVCEVKRSLGLRKYADTCELLHFEKEHATDDFDRDLPEEKPTRNPKQFSWLDPWGSFYTK
jgi:hypothetical protein